MARQRYKSLVDTFAADIRAGRLMAGMRLPTHRQLALDHGMSLATASRVYAELEAMGLVSGEAGRGTFVRETSLPCGLGIEQSVAEDVIDLSFNYPALPSQTVHLRTALKRLAGTGELDALLRYQPQGGRPHERAMMAQYIAKLGVAATAENLLIVNGAQFGLAAAVMAYLRPGDVVAVDALTYPGFKILAQTLRLELVAIPSADGGPDLTALAKMCQQRRIRALYCMPTMHNPLGWVMSMAQRRALIKLARQHDLLIIEDAAYAFLVAQAPPPLAALAPERVIYVSGFSKSVATGLRVGFVVVPQAMVPPLERVMRATVWNTPAIITAIVCEWLGNGTVKLFEAKKREDAQRRQALAQAVFSGMVETKAVGHPYSYFIWLPLPGNVRADKVAKILLQENIAISTAEPFAVTTHVPHAIRLALGSVPLVLLREVLLRVRAVVEGQMYLY